MQQYLLSLKLTFRSWWRNKLFAIISIVSLAIGITCTNLLATFVVHEYTIESSNPNRDRILRLTQEIPFAREKKQGNFVYGGSVPKIVSGFPEIQSYLRMYEKEFSHININGQEFPKQTVVCADSSFLQFF